MYNRYKDVKPAALEKLIEVCNKDIILFPDFKKSWLNIDKTLPNIPSFKRLSILYEKQEKYKEAIDICNKAIELGLKDNTKTGYEGRIKRLEKKSNLNSML